MFEILRKMSVCRHELGERGAEPPQLPAIPILARMPPQVLKQVCVGLCGTQLQPGVLPSARCATWRH